MINIRLGQASLLLLGLVIWTNPSSRKWHDEFLALALAVFFGLLYLYGRYLYFHGYAESAQGRWVIQHCSDVHVCPVVFLTCYCPLADWSRCTSVQRCSGCWSLWPGWGSSAPWHRPIWDWTCCTPLVMFWAWPNTHERSGRLHEAEDRESFSTCNGISDKTTKIYIFFSFKKDLYNNYLYKKWIQATINCCRKDSKCVSSFCPSNGNICS